MKIEAEINQIEKEIQQKEQEISEKEKKSDDLRKEQSLCQEKLAVLQEQNIQLQKSLAGLSFLALGKKKTLKEQIEKIEIETGEVKNRLQRINQELLNLDTHADLKELNSLQKQLFVQKEAYQNELKQQMKAEEKAVRTATEKPVAIPASSASAENESEAEKNSKKVLSDAAEKAFEKLEALYPEHKVFAFNSIDKHLQETFVSIYASEGFITVQDMMLSRGFEVISGQAVKDLRSFVMYKPGEEPEIIRSKVESAMKALDGYYPDHHIEGSIQKDHKNLSNTISGLYQWLGYEDAAAMLKAYGFEYVTEKGGRPQQEFQVIIDALVEKYKTNPKPSSVQALIVDNPEYKGQLKTMQNKSLELFGMSFARYCDSIGIVGARSSRSGAKTEEKSGSISFLPKRAEDILESEYAKVQGEIYGTLDEARKLLKKYNIRVSKGELIIEPFTLKDEEVVIPYGVSYLQDRAFYGSEKLRKISLPRSLKEIRRETFSGCRNLEEIKIPDSVTVIEGYAFSNCSALKSICIPESVKRIMEGAFAGCEKLSEVVFMGEHTYVSKDAFEGCPYVYEDPALENSKYFKYESKHKATATITGYTGNDEIVNIPEVIEGYTVTEIAKNAFEQKSSIRKVTMPDTILTIQGYAFSGCENLEEIHISESVHKIVTTTFNDCVKLRKVNIPNSVTEIKGGTFKHAPLKVLHIGKSLKDIDKNAFMSNQYDWETGQCLYVRNIEELTVDENNTTFKAIGNDICSKDGSVLYFCMGIGNENKCVIPEGIKTISDNVFDGFRNITDLVLPDSLETIGEGAFAWTAIRSLVLPHNLKCIGRSAFYSCKKLSSVIVQEGLEEIGNHAFAETGLKSIELPSTVRLLSEESFGYRYRFMSGNDIELNISKENPFFEADGIAFYEKDGSEKKLVRLLNTNKYQDISEKCEYTVLPGTTAIGDGVFAGCGSLFKISLPEGLKVIGSRAFANCHNLCDIKLPWSLQMIGENAFNSTALDEITIYEDLKEIGDGALSVNDPSALKIHIEGNDRFRVEDGMLICHTEENDKKVIVYTGEEEHAVIPEDVTEIGAYAFRNSNITELTISGAVKKIGENVFEECESLRHVNVIAEDEETLAIIYIPDMVDTYNSYLFGRSESNQFLDCIRVGSDGTIFDYLKYDGLFGSISTEEEKIRIAIDRLRTPIDLVPTYQKKYLSYLQTHAQKAIAIAVADNNPDGMRVLADLDVFTGQNIDELITMAQKYGKIDIASFLMDYKSKGIGIAGYDMSDFDL